MASEDGHVRETRHGISYIRTRGRRRVSSLDYFPFIFFLVCIGFLLFVLQGFVLFVKTHLIYFIIGASAVAFVVLLSVIKGIRRRSNESLLVDTADHVCTKENPSDKDFDLLAKLRGKAGRLTENVSRNIEVSYRELVAQIVRDGLVESNELERLKKTEGALQLSEDDIRIGRIRGFRMVHESAIGDGELTADEENSLNQVRASLQVPESAIQYELTQIEELRKARIIKESPLVPFESTVRLQKNEIAYHETASTELKKRISRTYTVDGVKHKEYEFAEIRSGKLVITNKRLLFVSDGTSSIKYDAILNIDVSYTTGRMAVVKDGRKNPHYFKLPEPVITVAHLAKAIHSHG